MELNLDLQNEPREDSAVKDDVGVVKEDVDVAKKDVDVMDGDKVEENEVAREDVVSDGPNGEMEEIVVEKASEAVTYEPPKTTVSEVTPTSVSGIGSKPKKKSSAMALGMLCMTIAALAGIAFGVWAMMDSESKKDELKSQISSLKTENDELQEMIGGSNGRENIDGGAQSGNSFENPVISSNSTEYWYSIPFNSANVSNSDGEVLKHLSLAIKDGEVERCSIDYVNSLEGGIGSTCSITGLNGSVYKVIEFGSGQDATNDKIGFIMKDGTVQYLSLHDAINNNDFTIDGVLEFDKPVIDSVGLQVSSDASGYFSKAGDTQKDTGSRRQQRGIRCSCEEVYGR